MSKSNLPITMLKKNNKDVSFVKHITQESTQQFILDKNINEFKTNSHKYNTRRKEVNKTPITINYDMFGNIEYTKIVVNALKEALNDNDKIS